MRRRCIMAIIIALSQMLGYFDPREKIGVPQNEGMKTVPLDEAITLRAEIVIATG